MKIVFVSAEDICNGEREKGNTCPIALALRRKLGHRKVMVGLEEFWVDGKFYKMSPAQKAFVLMFDNGKTVLPHIFFFRGL